MSTGNLQSLFPELGLLVFENRHAQHVRKKLKVDCPVDVVSGSLVVTPFGVEGEHVLKPMVLSGSRCTVTVTMNFQRSKGQSGKDNCFELHPGGHPEEWFLAHGIFNELYLHTRGVSCPCLAPNPTPPCR